MVKFIAVAIAFGGSAMGAFAQEETEVQAPVRKVAKTAPVYEMKEVSGQVIDAATGQPLDGARVQAFGHARYSVMTDEQGNYKISVPTFVRSLFVSVPEYNDVQVAVDEGKVPTVKMYSTKFKSVYTPTTSITADVKASVVNSSALSVDQEIENQLGGDVYTINRTGMPAQGAAMFIRGLNSLNINAQPLVVLDGIIMDMQLDRTSIHDGFFNNVLAAIDPEDIEDVQVMKNATALYGSRGANGVIIITTKRGHSMATKINVSAFAGFELKPSTMSMMNGSQYRTYANELVGTTEYGQEHGTASASIPFLNDNKNYYWYPMYHNNTDWSDGLYRAAFTQNYKVNVQGGDEIAMYNLSLGYANSNATIKNNDFDRLNIRFNTDIKLLSKLSTQLDIGYSRQQYNLTDNGWAESYEDHTVSSPNVLGLVQAPFLSKYAYYTDGNATLQLSDVYAGKYYDDANYPFDFASKYGSNVTLANPYWILQNGEGVNKNHQEVTQFNLNVMPKLEINDNFWITNRFAYQLNRANERSYLPVAGSPVYNLKDMGDIASYGKSLFDKETSLYEDFRLNWKANYGSHDVSAFGGFRFTSNSFSDNYMVGYKTPGGGNDKMPDLKGSDSYRSVYGTDDEWRNLAYYVQGNYSFNNTYYVQANLTTEASSRFGKEADGGLKMFGVTWGIFPSLQAGWVLTNEPWFHKTDLVNYLKLTAGFDVTGNDNVDYAASRTYFTSQAFLKDAIGLQLANIQNPGIKWETTRRWNIGLSGSFFNNRIQAGADFYISNTSDLLTQNSVDYLTGLSNGWSNGGELRNTGIDVHANAIIIAHKDFRWQLGASLGHYKNEITALPEGDVINTIYGAEILTRVGQAVGVFYGYKTEGVFATEAEASTAHNGNDYLKYDTGVKDASLKYRYFHAGDVHFTDLDGNGEINENDKTIIGDPNPDVYGNIYTNFGYKHWSLDITFKYSLGGDIYNYQRSQVEGLNSFYNQSQAAMNRWTNEGQITSMPRACATTSDEWVNNERFSDRWIEDGSYLKLKKVRLSYELPVSLSWLQGITVWGEANNLFVLSKYTGTDPEFSCGNSVLYQGIDAGLLPQNRSFNLGVKINL